MDEDDSAYLIGPDLPPERCRELAAEPLLAIRNWLELTGIGLGRYGQYTVSSEGIRFKKFPDEDMAGLPPSEQEALLGANEKYGSMVFPCTPIELLTFVDSAFAKMDVPDDFGKPF